jgi:bilirubin oxidase
LLSLFGDVTARVQEPIATRRSPQYSSAFQVPLTIPPVKKPLVSYVNPETGVPIDFYQVEVKQNDHRFYPNLALGKILGYDGIFPGPTFRVERGRETVIRAVNQANKTLNFHVHGSYSKLYPLFLARVVSHSMNYVN